ncbi:MAG: peptidase M28, partial [Candidatus Dadabacteria bacterium]
MGDVVRFALHKGLSPASLTPDGEIEKEQAGDFGDTYRVKLSKGKRTFTLAYKGRIFHPLEPSGKEQARGMNTTAGIISKDGAVLSGSSLWYPVFDVPFLRFSLLVEVPAGWDAVSQGSRVLHGREKDRTVVQWESKEPQDEIFLIAARFIEYNRSTGRVNAMAFLRSPDRDLAEKHLEATTRYIAMYEELIGPYPYSKFALVENFWETGFGMPSFTLLGPKVIRLPFIINSSFPHEILHNWWGNSVFPDYGEGNWSEGLTAYLSDHLIKEQQGSGAEYRQATLQKYADYVSTGRDFPLTAFRSRHSSPSEAVGYGKALMLFHMLRQELGDEDFIAGLRRFYDHNRFRIASFDDIRKAMEEVSGRDLGVFFKQWAERQGAPALILKKVEVRQEGDGYWLKVFLEQAQEGLPYDLRVPVAVTLEGKEEAHQAVITMEARDVEFSLFLPDRPLRVDIDPSFDLFRRLLREEAPAAISQALGSHEMLVILPSGSEKRLLDAYRTLADTLAGSGPERVVVKTDDEIDAIPSDRAVTVLGWENRLYKTVMDALRD